jgi:Lar family restriction alleviation protein
MDKLRECPFCGKSDDVVHLASYLKHKIKCEHCRCGTEWHSTEAEAISAWNSRPSDKGEKVCRWTKLGDYHTPECVKPTVMPILNHSFVFCPYCSGRIETCEGKE